LEKVKHQKNLSEVFPELTYEELAAAVEQWLNGGAAENEQEPSTPATEEASETEAATPATTSATLKTKAPAPAKSAKDVADEFSDLFNNS
jgi:hypothetical protein